MLSNYEVIDRLKNNLEVWVYSFDYDWINQRAFSNIQPCSLFLITDDLSIIDRLQNANSVHSSIPYLGIYSKTKVKTKKQLTSHSAFYTNYEDCKLAYNTNILSYETRLKIRAEKIQKLITEKYYIK